MHWNGFKGACKLVVILLAVWLLGKSLKLWNFSQNNDINFESFDNVLGSSEPIVPNVVHFFRLQKHTISFVEMVNVIAVWCNHKPDKIIIHCDCDQLHGRYWDMVKDLPTIEVHRVRAPKAVFGRPLSSVYHAADVLRLDTLTHYGGIALDFDVYVVGSLDEFRHFELTIGWSFGRNLGTQVIVAHRKARFLQLWLNSYADYRPERWYYNAGELPARILEKQLNLVHRVPESFGVYDLVSELYKERWEKWTTYHSIHLLARHRGYLDKESPIKEFNETNTLDYPFTYGQMVRKILYNTTEMLPANYSEPWKFRECRN